MADRSTYPSEQADKFLMRLPDGMRERLKAEAEKNGRSMNAEIVVRLESTFGEPAAPAFPEHTFHVVPGFGLQKTASGGMTLRDYFAAHALPGIAFDCGLSKEEAAARAYEFADAMVAERGKR